MTFPLDRTFVGNDVVDLNDPRLERTGGRSRFAARVLATSEQQRVESEADPALALWVHWAAKEAAFKAVSKALGAPPVFVHSAFEVDFGGDGSAMVRYESRELPVEISVEDGRVHALAWTGDSIDDGRAATLWGLERLPATPDPTGISDAVAALLSPEELATIHHEASAWCRIRARTAVADLLDVPEDSVRIFGDPEAPGRAPARLLIEGVEDPPDLTLSHHGEWIAWAILADGNATGGS